MFIIVAGAPRSGTTSLFNYLSAHPMVSPSFIKQTNYFLTELERYNSSATADRDLFLPNYLKLFSSGCGEWYLEASPDYLYSLKTARMIKDVLGDRVKLIFLLRDSVAQFESFFYHYKRLGKISAEVDIDDFVKSATQGGNAVGKELLEKGRYSLYLNEYLAIFGSDSVSLIKTEDLKERRSAVLLTLAGEIGVDADFYKEYEFAEANTRSAVRSFVLQKGYQRGRGTVLRVLRRFPLLRRPFSPVVQVLKLLYAGLNRNKAARLEISAESRGLLEAFYKADADTVSGIVSRHKKNASKAGVFT